MKTLPNPLYYLENFHQVLDWIRSRYGDLLNAEELAWMAQFYTLPRTARALLVRFVMRKGHDFRSSKLLYEEIGCPHLAARPLIEEGWVEDDPALDASALHGLLKKAELLGLLASAGAVAGTKKSDLLERVHAVYPDPVRFSVLQPESTERIYRLSESVSAFCDRLRLMFFGNLHQGWTEFVLADLGIYQYEKVRIDAASRGFRCREDVEATLHLHALRERFDGGEASESIVPELNARTCDSQWIARRRDKLLFLMAQQHERAADLTRAMELYEACAYPGARLRRIRIHEKSGDCRTAYDLAQAALEAPEDDAECQQVHRILPRLCRRLGLPKIAAMPSRAVEEFRLVLPLPEHDYSVELEVSRQLSEAAAPVFYVENALINSLFGLLCWDAVFHPLPGAFFHPFHTGPTDLHSPDFFAKRREIFDACFCELDTDAYKATIRRRHSEKTGIQSPFVFWGAMDTGLLELALECIPAAHLRHWFMRILLDTKANRNGFPDLIQFWPEEGRYRMIEVKAPGDRLQDNQLRMLDFASQHGMPVSVCYVEWAQSPNDPGA